MEFVDLNTVPSKALNYSTRLLLGQYLNPEQQLLSKDGFARDYRGLAEQMDFQYNEIRNFQRSDNPTLKILEAWTSSNTMIGHLVNFLENMGRHDIVQDLQPKFESDAKLYFQKNSNYNKDNPLQVPEVTSCRLPDSRLDDSGILTREDANTGEYTLYDAFVCYADEDIQFVSELAKFLESEIVGFKLFIRSRDMLAGHSEYETSMQLIQERCKRVLIVLSPDFLKCPACEVQASFAAGLGIDEKCRKLIPIIYKACEIPLMLKFISKIDFTKPTSVTEWIWEKLISSLQDGPSSFISVEKRNTPMYNPISQVDSGIPEFDNPAITFPSTLNYSALSLSSRSASSSHVVIQEDVTSESLVNEIKINKQKNRLQNFRSFWRSPKKADSYQNHENSTTSIGSSNATSGFHSQTSMDYAEGSRVERKIVTGSNSRKSPVQEVPNSRKKNNSLHFNET